MANANKLGNATGGMMGKVEGYVLGEGKGSIEGDHEGCVRGLLLGQANWDKRATRCSKLRATRC